MTPLHIAVDKNDFETVNFFMARLENKMPKSESGMTPLHICAKVGIKLQTTSIYTSYLKIVSSNMSRLEAHVVIFRLLMKGILDP